MLIDSHCHLNYLPDPAQALSAARAAGVSGFLCIGVDQAGLPDVLQLAATEADVWASVGLHPESVSAPITPQALDWIAAALHQPGVVAVGETGLDYYQLQQGAPGDSTWQQQAFAAQLAMAKTADLPVVVHTRAAEADTAAILRAHPDVCGVLHCFTESWALAKAALDLGWYISISGIVTFRNADNVREVARQVPLERLLVETDSPWLAPVPKRGKPNEPAYVVHTAAYLAQLRGEAPEVLLAATSENFFRLFARACRS